MTKNFHQEYEAATTKRERAKVMAQVPIRDVPTLAEMRRLQKERVCEKCGRKLKVRLTTNGGCCSIEYRYRVLICEHCSCMTSGTTYEKHQIAARMVREAYFRPYSHMSEYEYEQRDKKEPEMGWMDYFWEQQTGAAVRWLEWLDTNGYLAPKKETQP